MSIQTTCSLARNIQPCKYTPERKCRTQSLAFRAKHVVMNQIHKTIRTLQTQDYPLEPCKYTKVLEPCKHTPVNSNPV